MESESVNEVFYAIYCLMETAQLIENKVRYLDADTSYLCGLEKARDLVMQRVGRLIQTTFNGE